MRLPAGRGRRARAAPSRAGGAAVARPLPDHEGHVERDGVKIFYEVFGEGADDPAPADVVHRPFADLEDAGALPGPPLPGRHLRRAGQRALRPAGGRRAYIAATSSRPTPWPCWTPPAPTAHAGRVALAAARCCATAAGRRPVPSASPARLHLPDHAVGLVPGRARAARERSTRRSTATRAGPSTTHYWLRDYPGFLEFFFSQVLHRAALDQADRGLRRLGPRDRRPRRWPTRGAGLSRRAARRSALLARSAARCWSSTATRTPIVGRIAAGRALAEATRRRAGRRSPGPATCPHARDPVKVNLLLREFVGARSAAGPAALGRAGAAAAQARAVPLLPHRPRPRPARRGHRRRAAPAAARTWRSTGWRSIR